MKTKKTGTGPKGPMPTPPPLPGFRDVPEPPGPTPIDSATDKPKRERFQLSFDLNEDGSPDLSAMRDTTKKRAAEFFSDPKIAAAFGARPAGPTFTGIDYFPVLPGERYPAAIGSIYNLVGMVEGLAAQKFYSIPQPIVQRVFAYNDNEKEALAPVTAKVLNKHMPEWMIKWQDEVTLGSMLLALFVAKVQLCLALKKAQVTTMPGGSGQAESGENDKKPEVM